MKKTYPKLSSPGYFHPNERLIMLYDQNWCATEEQTITVAGRPAESESEVAHAAIQ